MQTAVASVSNMFAMALEQRWNTNALFRVPAVYPRSDMGKEGVRAVMIEGPAWKGRATRIFAYFALPEGASAAEKVPGVVLVHGGLCTASESWVRRWTAAGYAAIAMDTCGSLPIKDGKGQWSRHEFSGPPGWGRFATSGEPLADQWFHHAVSSVVLSHSFLGGRPEVDARRIGVVGCSWGGILACVSAAVDSRFAFAVPVYGCGFLGDHEFVSWRLRMQGATQEDGRRWLELWDPSLFLPYAKCPFLWVDSTNDFHFRLNEVAKSAALVQSSAFTTIVRMPHMHGPVSEARPEIFAFADHAVRGARDVVRFVDCEIRNGVFSATFDARRWRIARARLVFTVSDDADWVKREYKEREVPVIGRECGAMRVCVPDSTKLAFLAIDTEDGCTFCTPPQIVDKIEK